MKKLNLISHCENVYQIQPHSHPGHSQDMEKLEPSNIPHKNEK